MARAQPMAWKPRGLPIALLLAACSAGQAAAPPPTPGPTDVWLAMFDRTPFPYTTPLPPPETTPVDGMYAKVDPKTATPVPCRRCPDYAPEGGPWKMSLDRGIFRIVHAVTGWRSMGSYSVSRDRITLFNDPYCPYEAGVYTWSLAEGRLDLTVVDDPCAIELRALNLTSMPWSACQPPSAADPGFGAWQTPPGCSDGGSP